MGGRFFAYLNTAALIIETYDGSTPLVHHLKHYFAQFKKHGSKDRKLISHACYCYFRLGKAVKSTSTIDHLKIALFICNTDLNGWENIYNENWKNNWSIDLKDRVHFIKNEYSTFNEADIFPWQNQLCNGVDASLFSFAHLLQPFLFIRLRPSFEKIVVQRLRDLEVPFQKINNNCLALSNGIKLDDAIQLNKEAVVQDYSSQQIAAFFSEELIQLDWQKIWTVWDCCTASGGKTILLHDLHRRNEYYLSDVRASMQHQLKQRLDAAQISNWKFANADLTESSFPFGGNIFFDLIIADVPCTGSGTWSRTPEQIHFFNEESIAEYAATQKKIVTNVVNNLKAQGYLLYITCSTFKQENEMVATYIQNHLKLSLVKMQLLQGYTNHADTMFAALFRKTIA